MEFLIHKYSGAGNDFLVIDGRDPAAKLPDTDDIRLLCSREEGFRAADGRTGADGLMVLGVPEKDGCDFTMGFWNPDGSCGMMCGNGGRCIAAFADFLGIAPANGAFYVFSAPDGLHSAEVLSRNGRRLEVKLGMCDVSGVKEMPGGLFLNTGTRHFVTVRPSVDDIDVAGEGSALRHDAAFAPEGTNVNFVEIIGDRDIRVRTFEKGVEAETLACGTGIVASAIAVHLSTGGGSGDHIYHVHARTDSLSVSFTALPDGRFTSIHLCGPAERI